MCDPRPTASHEPDPTGSPVSIQTAHISLHHQVITDLNQVEEANQASLSASIVYCLAQTMAYFSLQSGYTHEKGD